MGNFALLDFIGVRFRCLSHRNDQNQISGTHESQLFALQHNEDIRELPTTVFCVNEQVYGELRR